MYRLLFLLFLCWCCATEGQAADKPLGSNHTLNLVELREASNPRGFNDTLNYCLIVHLMSTIRLIVKSASLEKGIWTTGVGLNTVEDYQPAPNPTGLVTTEYNPLRICVSGKPAPDPEGYKGHVIMKNESNNSTIQFNFAHLERAFKAQDFNAIYDTDKYLIEKIPPKLNNGVPPLFVKALTNYYPIRQYPLL